jgi:hypothetical protein
LRRFAAFSVVLRHFPANWRQPRARHSGVFRRFLAFSGIFRRFPTCSGVFRHFKVFSGALAIGFHCTTKYLGGSNPRPLFCLLKSLPKWGGQWPPSPLKTFFWILPGTQNVKKMSDMHVDGSLQKNGKKQQINTHIGKAGTR